MVPHVEAVLAVEKTLGRRVEVGAWLRAAPRTGEQSAPFGSSPFFAAIVGHELMTFDIRSPGPAVSRLASWHLGDLDSRRLSTMEVQLSVPLRPTPLTVAAADDGGRQLLESITRRSGPGRLRWIPAVLALAAAGFFARYLYRAVTIEGETAREAAPVAAIVAGVMVVLIGIFVLARIRRRKRFFNTPPGRPVEGDGRTT